MPGFNFGSLFSPPPIFSADGGGFGSYGMGDWGGSSAGYNPLQYGAMSAAGGTGGAGGAGTTVGTGVGDPKLGFNMGTAQLGLSGLATIGNLWAAFQAQKLARDQFKYTKQITDTNLTNQIKTYNTALGDRAENRSIVYSDPGYKQSYYDANALKKYGS